MTDTLEEKLNRLVRGKAEAAARRGYIMPSDIEKEFREPLLAAFRALSKVPHKIITKRQCVEVDPAGNTYEETEEHAGDCAGCEAVRVLALLDQDGEEAKREIPSDDH
jgi:hypothetical protein